MDNSLRETKDGSNCGVFVYIRMHYIFLNCLFKIDTSQCIDINIENKFFDKKRGRAKILKVINYYIDINNIAYVDSIEKEKRENDNQISEDEITKKE